MGLSRRIPAWTGLALWLATSTATFAGSVTVPAEYGKLIQQRGVVGALGDNAFGESIDLSSGGLEIVQTDVDLPGSNSLPVRLGRRFRASQGEDRLGHFGNWDLDIPHAHGEFYSVSGWFVSGSTAAAKSLRCSHFGAPTSVTVMGGTWAPDEYWHGNSFYLPGQGEQELLRAGTTAHVPGSGAYPAVTRAGAAVRCLTSLDPASSAGSTGEGFEIVTPEGTVYKLDHMVSRKIDGLYKSLPNPMLLTVGAVTPQAAVGYSLSRAEVFLYPTQIKDRFGNTVTYTWDSSNPWRLLQIASSDGRQLTFTYASTPADSYQVASVSDGTHVWTYTATGMTQPDGRSWTWNLDGLRVARPLPDGAYCDYITSPNLGLTATGTITAPAGASVTYTLTATLFGRSWMARECWSDVSLGGELFPRDPYLFENMAVTAKKITGPGLPAAGLTWTYAYGAPNHCWGGAPNPTPPGAVICAAGSPITRMTVVTGPEGDATRYTFGNKAWTNEGLLLKVEAGWNGSTALSTVAYEYASPDDAPYAVYNGLSVRKRGDYDITSRYRPQRKTTTTQQGRAFVWEVASDCGEGPYCFDSYARPKRVVKANTP
jgi:YD repeat-containing protein